MAEKAPDRQVSLVVEDESPTWQTLTVLLQQADDVVVEAADGQEALQRLRQELRPCLILLDLLLPWMNGWELREQQRSDPAQADIPLVGLSAGTRKAMP